MQMFSTTSYIYCLFLAVNGTSIGIRGREGGEVSLLCTHKFAQNNYKYFCRDPCSSEEHILAQVRPNRMTASGSVSLWDHGDGSFTVTLSHLKTSDSGRYRCAVSRTLQDTFIAVHLNIIKGFPFTTTTYTEGSTTTEVTSIHAYRTITNPTEEPLQTDSTTNSSKENKVAGLDVFCITVVVAAMSTVTVVLVLCLRKRQQKTRRHEQLCAVPLHLISHLHQVESEEPTESETTDRHIYENIHLHSKVSRNNHFPTYVQPLPALPKSAERINS